MAEIFVPYTDETKLELGLKSFGYEYEKLAPDVKNGLARFRVSNVSPDHCFNTTKDPLEDTTSHQFNTSAFTPEFEGFINFCNVTGIEISVEQ